MYSLQMYRTFIQQMSLQKILNPKLLKNASDTFWDNLIFILTCFVLVRVWWPIWFKFYVKQSKTRRATSVSNSNSDLLAEFWYLRTIRWSIKEGRLGIKGRASLYSRLPAGRNKSAGFLAQISCEVSIYFIPNLAFVILNIRKSVIFQILCHLKT